MAQRSVILPAILAVWGVGIVVYRLSGGGAESANPGYEAGADFALVTGVVMAVLGTLYIVRAVRQRG